MIEVSQMYKDTLASGTRNFNAIISITLEDGTILPTLTNANLRAFSIDDAVSDDNNFTMLGSVIINQCSIIIDNLSDEYNNYNFKYADVVVYLDYPLLDNTTERIRKGTFYVDKATYVGGTVELTCFDNMAKFDKDYALSNVSYPATVYDIVLDACTICGVPFSYLSIPNADFIITNEPVKEQTTFRQVLSWVAQIVGCYARCNTLGQLELKWCDTTILEDAYGYLDGGTFDSDTPYASGDIADGGNFNPWNIGYSISSASFLSQGEAHNFYFNYSQDIAIEDTIITGITIIVAAEESSAETNKYTVGSPGHILTIENNELITNDSAQTIVSYLSNQLLGMRFRKASTAHMCDPTIEAGDIAVLWNTRNRSYPIIVTHTIFKIGNQQQSICGVESPTKNNATRYTETTRTYLQAKSDIQREKTTRELAIANLTSQLANASGLYSTIETSQSGNIYYLHNRPDLDESQIIWKMTAEAWGVSSDGGQTWNGGMTVDGDTIVRILSAVGIDADWIRTGIIEDKKGLNYINLDNGNLKFRSSTSKAYLDFVNASLSTYTKSGIRGTTLFDNHLNFYNWGSDGTLAGRLTSTIDNSDSTKYGLIMSKNFAAQYCALGYEKNGNTSVYLGLELSGKETDTPVLYSHLEHKFRNDIVFEKYTDNSYAEFLKIRLNDTTDDTIKLAGICSKYLNITNETFPRANKGILVSSPTVRTTLGLSDYDYSNVTITDNVTIRDGFDLTLAGSSCHVQFKYNSSQSVDLYAWPKNGELCVHSTGGLSCSGTKNRIVETKEYGKIALSAYETTTPYFADIGSGILDTEGICYVELDNIFLATINTDVEYFVFLQKEGPGDVWVANKQKTYFEVHGTPNLKFTWEIKARQRNYEEQRLERTYDVDESATLQYADLGYSEYAKFINEVSNLPTVDSVE